MNAPEPLIVAKECAERGCCAHDPRIDGAGVLFHPAAPADDALTLLREFVDHYPHGLNPYLDAACNKARDILRDSDTTPACPSNDGEHIVEEDTGRCVNCNVVLT